MTGFPPTLQAHRLEIRGGAEGTDLQTGASRGRRRRAPPPGTHAAAAGRGPPPSPLRCQGTEDPRSTVAASCGCRGDLNERREKI